MSTGKNLQQQQQQQQRLPSAEQDKLQETPPVQKRQGKSSGCPARPNKEQTWVSSSSSLSSRSPAPGRTSNSRSSGSSSSITEAAEAVQKQCRSVAEGNVHAAEDPFCGEGTGKEYRVPSPSKP